MLLGASTVLVTGAGSGSGRAIAVELADAGALVLAVDRSLADLADLAALRSAILPIPIDLTAPDELDRLLRGTGTIDIVVTTASESFDLDADVVTAVALVRRLVTGMVARQRGHVVLVGPPPDDLAIDAFAATTSVLGGYADGLRREVAGRHVAVDFVAQPLAPVTAIAQAVREAIAGSAPCGHQARRRRCHVPRSAGNDR